MQTKMQMQIPGYIMKVKTANKSQTYTVQFSRRNEPEIGFVIGRLKKNGKRFVANAGDEKTLRSLVKDDGEEVIGRSGWVWMEENGKRNLFGFEKGARL